MMPRVAVIGAGWTGASVARRLFDEGVGVEVFERAANVGGHARAEVLNGVVYEPNGAHIFHTSDPEIAAYVQRFGLDRPYEHRVLAQVYLDPDDDEPVLLSWPPQLAELRDLPIWPRVADELGDLPGAMAPAEDFESHVVSMMGRTLYELFIRDYTVKQWGTEPRELSSRIAPKRVELRSDGNRRLFRDRWEFFPRDGYNGVIESMLAPVSTTCGVEIGVGDLPELEKSFDAVVLTAPLDDFMGRSGALGWRGIKMVSTYFPLEDDAATKTAAYVVNHPSKRVPYTRTVETKHATGQSIRGTVVSEEYPGSPDRHYPILTVDARYEAINRLMQQEISELSALPVHFCGRLAEYVYINQDEAIRRGFDCARRVLDEF